MTRRKLIAGNWKMHKTIAETQAFLTQFRGLITAADACDIVVAPPYTSLAAAWQEVQNSPIKLAAQELFYEDSGAFTGAISAAQLKDAGCTYALVGHSERRQLFYETLDTSRRRIDAALHAGLQPILCVGETLAERQQNHAQQVIDSQLDAATQHLDPAQLEHLTIAYEPVWAIGTGQVATPAQAQQAHAWIRARLQQRSPTLAAGVRILYGGSVKPDNAYELLQNPDIDGALVGGASLDPKSFAGIVQGCR